MGRVRGMSNSTIGLKVEDDGQHLQLSLVVEGEEYLIPWQQVARLWVALGDALDAAEDSGAWDGSEWVQ